MDHFLPWFSQDSHPVKESVKYSLHWCESELHSHQTENPYLAFTSGQRIHGAFPSMCMDSSSTVEKYTSAHFILVDKSTLLMGKVLYVRILGIHIRSRNPPLHSRQPWDLTLHSHQQWESRIHIRSRNPSYIHVSHGNPLNSLQWWEFSFNSQAGCESMYNSHWACESN